MEKYDITKVVEEDIVAVPFPEDVIGNDYATIKVKTGSRIHNLVDFALNSLKKNVSLVIFSCGPAVTKAVTIAEIIKRKHGKVYQWNKISFREIKEFWDPNEVGMTKLRVTREIPTMHIFLTTTPLDEHLPGVQAPEKKAKGSKLNKTKKSSSAADAAVAKNSREQKRTQENTGANSSDKDPKADGEDRIDLE